MKEYLYDQLEISEAKSASHKLVLSIAHREGLIADEQVWLEMLECWNDDVYRYNKSDALIYVNEIAYRFFDEVKTLIDTLQPLISEERINEHRIPES